MPKKTEEKREQKLNLWVSPSWKLVREGNIVRIESPAGFYPYEKDGLVEIEVLVKEK